MKPEPEFMTKDGATACGTPRERDAERAFRDGFVNAASEAATQWKDEGFIAVDAQAEDAWDERVELDRSQDPVRNAALRGKHHALIYITEAGELPLSEQRLSEWLTAVREWAKAKIQPGVQQTPPRLVTADEVEAYHMQKEKDRKPRAIAAPPMERADAICVAEVTPQPVRWLWPQRIALGKLSLIAGEPGLGKSFLTLDMAARVSRGDDWPCSGGISEPGGVVLLSAEDDVQDTIRPRLDAADADCWNIAAIQAVRKRNLDGHGTTSVPFSLIDHLHLLESTIRETVNCKLVIVDPVSAFLGSTDSHNNSEVRGVLAPLSELAARYSVAIVAVTHLNKGYGNAINRVIGSVAFTAAARAAYVVTRDEDDPDRRLMLPVKNNLGNDTHGFAYRLEGEPTPHIEWEPLMVTMSADEAIGTERKRGPQPEARRDAEAWLLDYLAAEPKPAKDVYADAVGDGHTKDTIRRAKAALKVQATKEGYQGTWMWMLPGSGPLMTGGGEATSKGTAKGTEGGLP